MEKCRSDTSEVNSSLVRKRKSPGSNRRITVCDGRIYYVYYTAHVIAICTYNELLYKILQLIALSPSMSSHVPGKIQFRVRGATEINGYCSLTELCYACYYGKIRSVDTWTKDLATFRTWMRNFGFEIDHADSNQLNCTVFNLSIMKCRINESKNKVTGRIKMPTILYSGYYGNAYRVYAHWPNVVRTSGKSGVEVRFKCKTARDYSECLRAVSRLECGYGKPVFFPSIEDQKAYRDRPCATNMDVCMSIAGQEWLASLSEDDFTWCKGYQVERLFREAQRS